MSRARSFLLSFTALTAATSAAQAEPISLGLAAFNAFLATPLLVTSAGATALTVGSALGAVFALGSVGLQIAFSSLGRKKPSLNPTDAKAIFESSEAPEIYAVGRVRLGGLKVFGNTKLTNRYRLIAHCEGQIAAIEAYFLGGREVTIESSGAVSSPPFAAPNGSYVYLSSKMGTGLETSWDILQSEFPSIWTANHRVRGIGQTLATYISPGLTSQKFQKIYQGGAPDVEIVARVSLPYDPRTGLYAWSDNGIVCALHIALKFPELDLDDFDLDFIADEADRADEIVAKLGGTEKRARAWGVGSSETTRLDALQDILRSIGAEIVENAETNKLRIRLIDDNRPPELSIPKKHIISVKWRSGPESVERPNFARVKYYSPERNYELAELNLQNSEWAVAQNEIDRVGVQIVDFEYRFCPSAAQAQRIARREFLTGRSDSGVLVTNLAGRAAWGLRTIEFECEDIGWITAEIGSCRIDAMSGEVEIPFVVQPELTPWNPATDESPAPPQLPELELQNSVSQPAAANVACIITYPGGSTETRFGYNDPGAGIQVEAVLRTYTSGLPNNWQSLQEYRAQSGASFAYANGTIAENVDIRIRHFNAEEDGSIWSPLYNVTPAALNTAPAAPGFSKVERLDDSQVDFSITAPNDIQVAYLVFAWSGDVPTPGSETIACRPGQTFSRTQPVDLPLTVIDQTATFTARAYSSNGTASGLVTLTVFIPQTGGS